MLKPDLIVDVGSTNVESIELMARNVAGERKGGLATVSIEQALL